MFFHIATRPEDQVEYESLSNFKIDNLHIQLDSGWRQFETNEAIEFRKGYAIDCKLEDVNINNPSVGNYCVIQYIKSDKSLFIHHDTIRGFPIYEGKHWISNIIITGREISRFYTVKIVDNLILSVKQPSPMSDIKQLPEMPLDEIIDIVEEELLKYIKGYLKHNNNIISASETYGYDSTVLMAIMNHNNIPYTKLDSIENGMIDSDNPLHTLIRRKNYWAYEQLLINPTPMNLITGYLGDGYLMRSPFTVHYYLKKCGIDFKSELFKTDSYQRDYIIERFIDSGKFDDIPIYVSQEEIFRIILSDYQMWHIEDTITVMPFKNSKILEISHCLKPNDALNQGLHAIIQHKIIEKRDPSLLTTLSKSKNEY